jgi:hypothetical protein
MPMQPGESLADFEKRLKAGFDRLDMLRQLRNATGDDEFIRQKHGESVLAELDNTDAAARAAEQVRREEADAEYERARRQAEQDRARRVATADMLTADAETVREFERRNGISSSSY